MQHLPAPARSARDPPGVERLPRPIITCAAAPDSTPPAPPPSPPPPSACPLHRRQACRQRQYQPQHRAPAHHTTPARRSAAGPHNEGRCLCPRRRPDRRRGRLHRARLPHQDQRHQECDEHAVHHRRHRAGHGQHPRPHEARGVCREPPGRRVREGRGERPFFLVPVGCRRLAAARSGRVGWAREASCLRARRRGLWRSAGRRQQQRVPASAAPTLGPLPPPTPPPLTPQSPPALLPPRSPTPAASRPSSPPPSTGAPSGAPAARSRSTSGPTRSARSTAPSTSPCSPTSPPTWCCGSSRRCTPSTSSLAACGGSGTTCGTPLTTSWCVLGSWPAAR
jgi:hypothetical protein